MDPQPFPVALSSKVESRDAYNKAMGVKDASKILTAAVDFNDVEHLRKRIGVTNTSFHGSNLSTSSCNLALLALNRSCQAVNALRLAQMWSNPYNISVPPTTVLMVTNSANKGVGIVPQPAIHSFLRSIASSRRELCGTGFNPLAVNPSLAFLNRKSPVSTEAVTSVVNNTNEEALETLGSACLERRKSKTPYFDASTLQDPDAVTVANRRTRGGVTEPFPEKLYRMLIEAKDEGNEEIMSFCSHGRAFGIHKPEQFSKDIMPKYFKQSRLSSFQRQLNLYGFTRINTGPDAGGYYHELFLRGRPALCVHIRRVGVPQATPRRRGVKSHDATVDPDFYSIPPIVGETVERSS
jgi:hypothetical protein